MKNSLFPEHVSLSIHDHDFIPVSSKRLKESNSKSPKGPVSRFSWWSSLVFPNLISRNQKASENDSENPDVEDANSIEEAKSFLDGWSWWKWKGNWRGERGYRAGKESGNDIRRVSIWPKKQTRTRRERNARVIVSRSRRPRRGVLMHIAIVRTWNLCSRHRVRDEKICMLYWLGMTALLFYICIVVFVRMCIYPLKLSIQLLLYLSLYILIIWCHIYFQVPRIMLTLQPTYQVFWLYL